MLKNFKNTDIDLLMSIWKKEYISKKDKVNSEELTKKYTEIRDLFLDETSNTILYTEDDVIEGFITIDKDNKIALIYVDKKIRREGIGSVLIEACKKKYNNLSVDVKKEDECYKGFFEKNEFDETQNNDEQTTYEWNNNQEEKVNVIYFDDDLNEKLLETSKKIRIKNIRIKNILQEDKELKLVKNYMKVRENIEKSFSKKVLLYLNYGNYNEVMDDIIKEIAKIKKVKFAVIVSEPLIIENSKMEMYLNKILASYSDFKIYKIDTITDMKKDISVNRILEEKMRVIIEKIKNIAENM